MSFDHLRRLFSFSLLTLGIVLLIGGIAPHSWGKFARRVFETNALGGSDLNLITGPETSPNISQNNSATWGHGDTVVVVYDDGRDRSSTPSNVCGVSVSTDNGATFNRITPNPFPSSCLGNGSVFYSVRAAKWFASFRVAGCGYGGIAQWESVDATNWTASGCLATTANSQVFDDHSTWVDNNPASPYYGRQYAAFNASPSYKAQAVYSSDDGVTWSSPGNVNSSASNQRVVNYTGSRGTDGTIFVQTVYEGTGGIDAGKVNYIYRSTNGGLSWEEKIQGPNFFYARYFGPGRANCTDFSGRACMYAPGYWWDEGWGQAAVGPNGVVHYVYSAWPDENDDPGNIYYVRSTDNGSSWSPRILLSADASKRAQWNPALAVNAQGVMVASWYDERNTTDNSLERYARVSMDNGATWGTEMAVSDVIYPVPLRPDTSSEVGKHNFAMFSDDGFGGDAYITWVDGRVAINGSPQQDIFFDKIPLVPPGVFRVTTVDDHDDGTCNASDCTLREAITAVNTHPGRDFIRFNAGVTGIIQLASALPNLSTSLEINGPGANLLTVRRNTGGDYRIFSVTNGSGSGPTVTISGLSIANGSVSGSSFPGNAGGGVYSDHAKLTLLNCVLSGNAGGFTGGGGIYSNGGGSGSSTLILKSCTLSANTATGAFGGGIYNSASGTGAAAVTLENCTLSGNSASSGGGVFNFGGGSAGKATLTVTNCTFAGNNATSGGGIFNDKDSTGTASLTIANTILKAGFAANFANDGTITSLGHNLSSDAANGAGGTAPGGYLNATGDKRNTDPLLDALKDNGGSTPTQALLAGSPAINAGDDALAPKLDQRGYLRLAAADIGAFELNGAPLRITSITRLTNGHIVLVGTGVINGVHTVQKSTDPIAENFGALGQATANSLGIWQYEDSSATGQAKGFYRATFP